MKKFTASLITSLIPSRKLRKKLKERLISGKLRIEPGNVVELAVRSSNNIGIHGRGNRLVVKTKEIPLRLEVSIVGNGNEIVIEEGFRAESLCRIIVGTDSNPCDNAKIHIGKNTRVNDVYFLTMEDDSFIEVGEDCLFSWGVYVWATDSHAIFETSEDLPCEANTENVRNCGKFVKIGNHVWLGMDVKVGKNTEIGDGCVVGWSSVVTGAFPEKNCVIAGVPAKIIKQNRSWHYRSANMFLRQKDPS